MSLIFLKRVGSVVQWVKLQQKNDMKLLKLAEKIDKE